MEKINKLQWIEVLRAIATLTVVFLHISMTVIVNYTFDECGGLFNYIILDICQLICRWTVPCFIMITRSAIIKSIKRCEQRKDKKIYSKDVISTY